MIGSLSKNLFFQLQAKGEWLPILESLKSEKKKKKKKMANGLNHQPSKTRRFYELKGYVFVVSIWGSYLKLLLVDFTSR